MRTLTTNNIKISVITKYEPSHSRPGQSQYAHSYWIKIENQGHVPVQLLSREWLIKDSKLTIKKVEGDGVIGQQPIIDPGSYHQYSSWCPITSDIGRMSGKYKMVRLPDEKVFYVDVPPINMIYPPVLN